MVNFIFTLFFQVGSMFIGPDGHNISSRYCSIEIACIIIFVADLTLLKKFIDACSIVARKFISL